MKIVEVSFEDYVRRPENQHNTNVLRLGRDNAIGISATVDTIDEDAIGILVSKTVTDREGARTMHTARYPWHKVKDVKYEPDVEKPVVPITKAAGPALKEAVGK